MTIKALTLFPEMFAALDASIVGRAAKAGVFSLEVFNIRDYTQDKHRRCDDYPFGGGAGLVMSAQPILDAAENAAEPLFEGRRIYLSPRGKLFTQSMAEKLAREKGLLLLCGHYEGVDQRALDIGGFEEVSVGDYVLTGGELPAMTLIDAVVRLLPGALGSDESAGEESHSAGLLEYPQYTRPSDFRGAKVPEVLLGGHHAEIEKWRRRQSLLITQANRPDMLAVAELTDIDRNFLWPDEYPLPQKKRRGRKAQT